MRMTIRANACSIVLATALAVGAAGISVSAARVASHDPGAYTVPMYTGPLAAPDFRHAPKSYRYFKTVLREGARRGVNYAGHYALIMVGCGTGCCSVMLIDARSGRIIGFPLGGEMYNMLALEYRPTSRLITAHWEETSDINTVCVSREYVLTGTTFRQLNARDARVPGRCPSY